MASSIEISKENSKRARIDATVQSEDDASWEMKLHFIQFDWWWPLREVKSAFAKSPEYNTLYHNKVQQTHNLVWYQVPTRQTLSVLAIAMIFWHVIASARTTITRQSRRRSNALGIGYGLGFANARDACDSVIAMEGLTRVLVPRSTYPDTEIQCAWNRLWSWFR